MLETKTSRRMIVKLLVAAAVPTDVMCAREDESVVEMLSMRLRWLPVQTLSVARHDLPMLAF